MMMKNKSTLAKLLSEEDIFVVHKQMETAYFDSKKRELGLPIWKDEEMTQDIYDTMVCHEIGHALWTPLDMLEKAAVRKINHSFVNIIEDARIEKKGKTKYPGITAVMKRGYSDLLAKDFFGIDKKPIGQFSLIDRINVFFKTGLKDIVFSETEIPWVKKVAACETPDEVLDLAEELYKWMEENPESQGENSEENSDGDDSGDSNMSVDGMGSPSGDSADSSNAETDSATGNESKDEDGESAGGNPTDEKEDEDGNADAKSPSDDSGDGDDSDSSDSSDKGEVEEGSSDLGDTAKSSDEVGGEGGEGASGNVGLDAETDGAFGKALQKMRDMEKAAMSYARIPTIDRKKVIKDFSEIEPELTEHYSKGRNGGSGEELFWNKTLEEVETLKKESKKTVAYMVKEFEMKKSADQYARASVSKTGSLNMSKLHTYKFNEDLFKKVTTLPGATNHGLVIVVDWSGSMADNLKGTVAQLFNLVWFCRRTKIPFEVFAFSDNVRYDADYTENTGIENFQPGCFNIKPFKMMNFLSSRMTVAQENNMLHNIWMMANQWGYRQWDEMGYPIRIMDKYNLSGTPLQEAVVSLFDIVPTFQKDSGVQKVHTVFLTDGAGSNLQQIHDWKLITEGENKGDHYKGYDNISLPITITDPVTHKSVVMDGKSTRWSYRVETMPLLMELLKKRLPEMNIVGFFIAGSRNGRISSHEMRYIANSANMDVSEAKKMLRTKKFLETKENGFDSWFIIPGGSELMTENEDLDDALIGASKAKLKTAFGKNQKGKISSRSMLNRFVKMVA